jgi:hypothetical protein
LHRNRRAGRAFNTIREKAPESSRFSTVTDQQRRLAGFLSTVT